MSRVENFKSILDFNPLTRLKYSDQTSWFNSNTQVKNSDLNQVLTSQVLNSNLSTQLDAISLIISKNQVLLILIFIDCII